MDVSGLIATQICRIFTFGLMITAGYYPTLMLFAGFKKLAKSILHSYSSTSNIECTAIMFGGIFVGARFTTVFAMAVYLLLKQFVSAKKPNEIVLEVLSTFVAILLIPNVIMVTFGLTSPHWMTVFGAVLHVMAKYGIRICDFCSRGKPKSSNDESTAGESVGAAEFANGRFYSQMDLLALFMTKIRREVGQLFDKQPLDVFMVEMAARLPKYAAALLDEVDDVKFPPKKISGAAKKKANVAAKKTAGGKKAPVK